MMTAMNSDARLEAIERSVFRYYWEDGLIDLLLGVGLLLIGVAWLLEYAALTGVVPAVLLPVWVLLRAKVTVPRAGSVVFSNKRMVQTRLRLNIASLIGFALLTVLGALFWYFRTNPSASDEWVTFLIPSLPSLLLALGLFVVWVAFSMPRFGIHAAVVAVVGVIGLGGIDPGWQFVGAGVLISIIGAQQFAKFLRDFPDTDAQDGQPV